MLIIQPRFTVFLAFVVLAALSVFGPRCSDARDQPAPQVEVTTTIEVIRSVLLTLEHILLEVAYFVSS